MEDDLTCYFIIGCYIADEMCRRMPCLSCAPHNKNVIQVTISEADKYNELWGGEDHEKFVNYSYELKNKYLPKEYKHLIGYFHKNCLKEENLKEIKRAIRLSLWDYDHSDYFAEVEDIVITKNYVIIPLGKNPYEK